MIVNALVNKWLVALLNLQLLRLTIGVCLIHRCHWSLQSNREAAAPWVWMQNSVTIPVISNSPPLLCSAASTGCASRLQKGICRGGSSWQPRGSEEPWPRTLQPGPVVLCAPEEKLSRICLCPPAGSRHCFDFKFLTQTRQTGLDAAALGMPGEWPCASGEQSSLVTGLCSSSSCGAEDSGSENPAGHPWNPGSFWSAPFSGSSTNPTVFSSADLHWSKE